MVMKLQLVNEQVLQWKMNQSLMQSIQILQLSNTELVDYLKELEKENPLIEEINYDDPTLPYGSSTDDVIAPGEINASELSMYDHLKKQLYILHIPEKMRPIVLYGIDSINENGYLDVELQLWAKQCHATLEQVEQAVKLIQSLEPAGIGARTLSECIILQLKISAADKPLVHNLLENHLQWVAEEDVEAVANEYGKSETYVKGLFAQIKACHPKPGHLLDTKIDHYIIPEASIYKENGKWQLSFYSWSKPKITLNEAYFHMEGVGKETEKYIKEKQTQIEMVKKAITYRGDTLERVIQCMVEKQSLYFEQGTHMMQPLTLKDIAEELALHVSTISRAIAHKYVQTPNGILPLNFFLQSGVKQSNGTKASALAIKNMIADLIAQEDKYKPLSDEKLRKLIAEKYTIQIARRTVMKYREQLQIPSSTKRKEC